VKARTSHRQSIHPDVAYPLPAFKVATGLGDKALRQARRAGLRILYLHGRGFVRGSDFLSYLDRIAEGEATHVAGPKPPAH
jgi:hypothetical protein